MAKRIFVAATEPNSGKSVITVGLIDSLYRFTDKVGYFKPIIRACASVRQKGDTELLAEHFKLAIKGVRQFTVDEVGRFITENRKSELLEEIVQSFTIIEKDNDIVVIEGTDYSGMIAAFEFDINADISKNLNAPVLMVANGWGKNADEIIANIQTIQNSFEEKNCDLLGVVVNKVQEEYLQQLKEQMQGRLETDLFGLVPYKKLLSKPRVGHLADVLQAEVLYGENYLSNIAFENLVVAMSVHNALQYFKEGTLIITPGDRDDILIMACLSQVTHECPRIAGIILTGGLQPKENVFRMVTNCGLRLPILSVSTDTYTTAVRISDFDVLLQHNDAEKIALSKSLVDAYLAREKIYEKLHLKKTTRISPKIFQHELIERARSVKKRIVLPEGTEERTLQAAAKVIEREIAEIILLGDPQKVGRKAKHAGIPLEKITIIDPATSPHLHDYAEIFAGIRKHKQITLDQALDIMQDPIYYGTMMVHLNDADGLVSGAVHTTQHTIRPAFQIIKTQPGISLVSSVFFMCLEDRVLVYGDCAVNPDPTAEELADIALTSAATSRKFGIEPRVAMISYSTGTSGKGSDVEKVREATRIAREKQPHLLLEGPIQYDAAVSVDVARSKLPGSSVAGQATVFIFPDLNTGNTTYKAVQRSANAVAIGPVLQGLNKPVNDLSRGCLVEDIIFTIAITAVQAQ